MAWTTGKAIANFKTLSEPPAIQSMHFPYNNAAINDESIPPALPDITTCSDESMVLSFSKITRDVFVFVIADAFFFKKYRVNCKQVWNFKPTNTTC